MGGGSVPRVCRKDGGSSAAVALPLPPFPCLQFSIKRRLAHTEWNSYRDNTESEKGLRAAGRGLQQKEGCSSEIMVLQHTVFQQYEIMVLQQTVCFSSIRS